MYDCTERQNPLDTRGMCVLIKRVNIHTRMLNVYGILRRSLVALYSVAVAHVTVSSALIYECKMCILRLKITNCAMVYVWKYILHCG